MKKLLISIIALLIVGGIFYAYKEYQRKAPETSSLKADFKLTANELFDAFENDEERANELYIGKVIEVTGIVDLVEIVDDTKSITLLADNAMMGGINCQVLGTEKIESIEIGAEITVKGICQGFLMSVILNRSVVAESK